MSAAGSQICIGISACLLGQKVRHDGGHKRDSFLTDTFGRFVTFVPVCPEVEIGLGTPREAIHLTGTPGGIRLVAVKSGTDLTDTMSGYAERKVRELSALDLSGYILKKDSPSCGMERVKVHGPRGGVTKSGRGLFAEALLSGLPFLPVEEEGRLHDPRLRENFVERVFAYHRLRALFGGTWKLGDLVRFHTAEKLLLLAHEPAAYQALGRLVASAKGTSRSALSDEYQRIHTEAFRKLATVSRHVNVLQHMAGYFKKLISPDEKQELAGVIDEYRRGLVPLVVPLTLIRHHLKVHKVAYLEGQVYLEPHPRELMLRNHV